MRQVYYLFIILIIFESCVDTENDAIIKAITAKIKDAQKVEVINKEDSAGFIKVRYRFTNEINKAPALDSMVFSKTGDDVLSPVR